MKKLLYFSVALLTTLSLGACGDDDEPGSGSAANVQFSASSYTLDDEPIDVKGGSVAGCGVGSEYRIHGRRYSHGGRLRAFRAELPARSRQDRGDRHRNAQAGLQGGQDLTFNLAAGNGICDRRVASTTVNLVESSVYVYSFTTAEAELQESLDITLTVGDDNFKAPKDLELPFEVLSGSTAELGKHFLVKDDATSLLFRKTATRRR